MRKNKLRIRKLYRLLISVVLCFNIFSINNLNAAGKKEELYLKNDQHPLRQELAKERLKEEQSSNSDDIKIQKDITTRLEKPQKQPASPSANNRKLITRSITPASKDIASQIKAVNRDIKNKIEHVNEETRALRGK